MSDSKLFNIKNSLLYKKKQPDIYKIRHIIESNAMDLLGLNIITTEFIVSSDNNEIIDVIGFDENNQLSIIEYRRDKYGFVVGKSLMCIDYIVQNPAHLKTVLDNKVGFDIAPSIYLKPRLLLIGDNFNKYDEYTIQQMPYMIDLIKCELFNDEYLLLEKVYQSKKIDCIGSNSYKKKALIKIICDFILSLGDDVCEIICDNFYVYRKIKNFAYLIVGATLELRVLFNKTYKTFIINDCYDFEKNKKEIENSYACN